MKLPLRHRRALHAAALIGIGVLVGIALVTEFSSIPATKLFGQNLRDLGAKKPPVTIPDNVRALNDAFVAAANAVSPTVVSIELLGEDKRSMRFFGPEDFFRFFEDPWGDNDRVPPRNQQRDRDDSRRWPAPIGQGSGVIISSDGYIITNNHVIAGARPDGIKVILSDKREFIARVIGRDSLTDLAVIKIDARDLPVAYLGTRDDIKVGEWVIAVGNPFGLRSTVTAGIISATGRGGMGLNGGGFAIENYIQTDAAINPGNSGGGLFTLNGTLIGINTAIASNTGSYAGYGFAIPVDIVRVVALNLINYGKVNRAYLGVMIRAVDETDAEGVGLSKVQGVMVQEVLKGSPAEKAGLQTGDVILDLDGTAVNSPNELQTLVLQRQPGEKVKLRIWRNRKEIVKDVKLEARDGSVAAADKSVEPTPGEQDEKSSAPVTFGDLGFTIAPLSAELKEKLNISKGVEVTNVERYSPAYMRGLARGAVIEEADSKPIESPGQLKAIINSKKTGEVILLKVKSESGTQIVSLRIPPSKAN